MVVILIKIYILLISATGAKILGYIPSLHSSMADQFNALTTVSTAAATGMLAESGQGGRIEGGQGGRTGRAEREGREGVQKNVGT